MSEKFRFYVVVWFIAMFTFGLVGVSAQGTDGTCDSIEFDDEAGFSSFRIAVGEWLCHQGVSIDDWWSVIGEEF